MRPGLNMGQVETLEYTVAPFPSDYECYFLLSIMQDFSNPASAGLQSDVVPGQMHSNEELHPRNAIRIGNAQPAPLWRRLVNSAHEYFTRHKPDYESHQQLFQSCFAPQIQRIWIQTNAAMSSSLLHLIACAPCSLISGGRPFRGLAYLTVEGVFFSTRFMDDDMSIRKSAKFAGPKVITVDVITHSDGRQKAMHANPSEQLDRTTVLHYDEYGIADLTDVIEFSDVASVLPSIAATTVDGEANYVFGIPSTAVRANAIQLYTCHLRRVVQLTCFEDVYVFPPAFSAASRGVPLDTGTELKKSKQTTQSGSSFAAAEVCGSEQNSPVLSEEEVQAMIRMPRTFSCVAFFGILHRLWLRRLSELGVELPQSGVTYAKRH